MTMTSQKLHELRTAPRYKMVSTQLPGKLYLAESKVPVFAVAVDASKFGLGIAMAEQLLQGTMLVFEINGTCIPLRVVWNKKREKNLYRRGLEVTDKSLDLEDLLFASGCLEVNLDMLD